MFPPPLFAPPPPKNNDRPLPYVFKWDSPKYEMQNNSLAMQVVCQSWGIFIILLPANLWTTYLHWILPCNHTFIISSIKPIRNRDQFLFERTLKIYNPIAKDTTKS